MVFELTLTPDNTERKEDTGANLELKIYLNDIWEEIKEFDRIYVYSIVTVPIVVEGVVKKHEIILRNHFQVSCILVEEDSITIVQSGYYEGLCKAPKEIQIACNIWRYKLEMLEEVAG